MFLDCLWNISSVRTSKSNNKNVELRIGKTYKGDAVTSGDAEASNLLRVPDGGMFLNSTAGLTIHFLGTTLTACFAELAGVAEGERFTLPILCYCASFLLSFLHILFSSASFSLFHILLHSFFP